MERLETRVFTLGKSRRFFVFRFLNGGGYGGRPRATFSLLKADSVLVAAGKFAGLRLSTDACGATGGRLRVGFDDGKHEHMRADRLTIVDDDEEDG